MTSKKGIIIVGPTASGKSGLALQIAQTLKTSIINADAMQIYQDLQIVSARPSLQEMQGIPHLLYGYADAHYQGSVQNWLQKVVPVINQVDLPVLVGGTGMYISSLVNGMNEIPETDPYIRQQVRSMPIEEVKSKVQECSALDPQRLRRALEVQLSTGHTLAYFLKQPKKKVLEAQFQIIFINPPRQQLYQRCEQRFNQMIEQGGIQEVEKLLTLSPTGGVLKAIGVPEIISYIQNEISKEEMIHQAILSTRHYAKRQITWFKHQIESNITLEKATDFKFKDLSF